MKTKLLALIFIISLLNINAQTALNFDGVDNYVLGTNNASLNLTQGTVEAWIKTSDAGTGYRGIIVKQYNYGIFLNNNKLIAFEWISGSLKNTNINLADDIWHHVAFTFQSEVVNGSKLYIDGNPVLTFTYKIGHFDRTIAVGNGKDDTSISQFFNGEIDQVRVWNTVRSDADILANYNKCLQGNENSLVMYWNFDEGSGTTVTDTTDNNNNGTLTNMDAATDWVNGYDCSLVAYYPFNGNANDESGNNHHGTVIEANLTADKDGNVDSAYYFDGENDYIDLGDWENGGAMTFTFWARWDALNYYSRIIDLGNGSSSNNIIIANYRTEDKLLFSTYNNNIETIMYKSTITLNQWDFYSATVDENGVMTTYKNGQEIQKTTGYIPYLLLRTEQFIGKSNFSADEYFKGAIDELKIYNKALTADELFAEYNTSTAGINDFKQLETNFYVFENVLYFKNNQNLLEIKTIEIFNLMGQQIYSTSTIKKEIPIQHLQKGIYILKVENVDGNYSTLKFIIN